MLHNDGSTLSGSTNMVECPTPPRGPDPRPRPKPQFHSLFLSEAAPKASSTPGSLTGRARTVASWPYRYVLANAFFALHAKRLPICASLSLDHSQLRPPTHAAAHPGAARSAR